MKEKDKAVLMTLNVPSAVARHRLAMVLDLISGFASFFVWIAVAITITQTLHSPNNLINLVCGGLPGALWLALLLVLAWRGQTPGQAILRIHWTDPSGHRAHWRPVGEVGFWFAGFFVFVAPLVFIASTIVGMLHWNTPLNALYVPDCAALVFVAFVLARYIRRSAAHLQAQ